MLLLQPLIGVLLISLAHGNSCPISFSRLDVVVKYGDSFSVTCSTSNNPHQFSLSWDGFNDRMVNITEIYKDVHVTDWEMNVTCYMNSEKTNCSQNLPVTIYKTPDSVSIITVNHTGPMKEGEQYELQCEVLNVAPVQELTVKWYKGQTLLNQTSIIDTIDTDSLTPESITDTLLIRPDRADDGAQYRCEAELDLEAEGPQPRPKVTSDPLNTEVYYKPQHSSSTESIIKGQEVMLDCTVKANPAPTYTWDHLEEKISSSVLQSSTLNPGNYTCTATNTEGSDTKVFSVKSAENPCPVQLNPQRAVVRHGGSAEANCSTSVSHEGMGWEASQGVVPMTRDQSLITWRVSAVTEWDIKPFCYINIDDQDQCLLHLPVTVYKTPDSVSIITVNHTGPMKEGEQYELQCEVLNVAPVQNLTVKWYKGQTLLNQTSFTDTIQTPVNKIVTLLIRPDGADDGAQYRCEAELDLGAEGPQPPPKVTSDPLSITVHFVPQIIFCSSWSPLTGTSLDSYNLNSNFVVGNPRPDIFWRHKTLSINSSIPLTKYDSGLYEIVAKNYLNSSSCFVKITVEYPPELNCNKSYEVKEKTLFKHPCIVTGFPEPEFILYKNGKRMQRDFYPKWNDSGLYELYFRNQRGNINTSFTLNILHAPVIFNSQEKFVVAADSKITLECNSTGNPKPDVWWSVNNKNISTGRRPVINIERAGAYTCSARNEFGQVDKIFVVEIKDEFPVYIIILVVVLVLFFSFILFMVLMRKRSKSRGRYDIQSAKPHEMQTINNGGPK